MKTVLLIGNLRASLTLARTLSRAGYRVVAGLDEADPYLFLSRHVTGHVWHAPLDTRPDPALDTLVAAARDFGADIIVPVSEVATRLLAEHRGRFTGIVIAAPDPGLVRRCADKAGLFALCDRLGIPVARRTVVSSLEAVHGEAAGIGYPLIVKPTDSTHYIFGRKAVIVEDSAALARVFSRWPAWHETLCLQRYVRGTRLNVYFGAARGRCLGAVCVEIARTDAPNGTGYAVAGRSIEASAAIRMACERLIGALDYTGVGCVQFMRDAATGEISFLEINPRLGANYKIAEACALPLSRWTLDIAADIQPEARGDVWAHPTGVRYAWTKGALSGLVRAYRAGEVGTAGLAAGLVRTALEAFAPCHLTFDVRDPMPSLGIYLNPLLGPRLERRSRIAQRRLAETRHAG